ncbi:acyloxyacyl hydrolase [Glaciecola sp. 1036]|uniref:acyloxyacyl hydrolase n=1 Tax=Alteromonadaceae TaxID=72275 RepID=UPI003CFC73E8
MRSFVFCLTLLISSFSLHSHAQEISISGGEAYGRWTFPNSGKLSSTVVRIGYISPALYQWNFDATRLQLELEAGAHFWQDDWNDRDKKGIYLNPMWRLYYPVGNQQIYAGIGVGLAYSNGENLLDRQLGTHLLFEDRFEFGAILAKQHRVSLSINHYSNANFASINHGVNLFYANYAYKF